MVCRNAQRNEPMRGVRSTVASHHCITPFQQSRSVAWPAHRLHKPTPSEEKPLDADRSPLSTRRQLPVQSLSPKQRCGDPSCPSPSVPQRGPLTYQVHSRHPQAYPTSPGETSRGDAPMSIIRNRRLRAKLERLVRDVPFDRSRCRQVDRNTEPSTHGKLRLSKAVIIANENTLPSRSVTRLDPAMYGSRPPLLRPVQRFAG